MTSKKNWTMRAAGLMLALVLITSCFTGGTFAKYVTSGNGSDTARVAKFGVTVSVKNNTVFHTTYATKGDVLDKDGAKIENSVVSDNGENLVAPGTKEEGTATFSVTGTPEVAVNVKLALEPTDGNTEVKDVFLKAGTYDNYTTAATDDTFELTNDYYPVKFTLKKGTESTTGTLADINAKLAALSKNYPANTTLDDVLGEYTLSWEWAFENNDAADTLLGNLAAGTAVVDAAKYSTQIAFKLTATVTQID